MLVKIMSLVLVEVRQAIVEENVALKCIVECDFALAKLLIWT